MVMGMLIDRPIESSSLLTEWEAKTLIENLKAEGDEWILSNKGSQLINHVELIVQFQCEQQPVLPDFADHSDQPKLGDDYSGKPPITSSPSVRKKKDRPYAWPDLSSMW